MIKKLVAGAAVALTLAGVPALSAGASVGNSRHALPVRIMHIRTDGMTATVTIRGDWRLAHVGFPLAIQAAHATKARTSAAAPRSTVDSGSWSGYVDAGKTIAFRFASVDFPAVNVDCAVGTPGSTGKDDVATWVGLDGWNSETAEMAGFADICSTKPSAQTYYTWYETAPDQPVTFTGAHPGDFLEGSVYYDAGADNYQIDMTDLTQSGAGFSVNVPCASESTCENSSAEVITEATNGGPAAGMNLADFGAIPYSDASVTARNGTKGNLSGNPRTSP
jgi:Peptidase A4 family